MIRDHNEYLRKDRGLDFSPLHIRKQVFFTGYLLSTKTTAKLLEALPPPKDDPDIRCLASNIMIIPRRASQNILNKAGGLGHEVEWEVVGIGSYQDRIWAARVEPVDPKAQVYTDNQKPFVVLAHRRNSKPVEANQIRKWQEVEEPLRFKFKAKVGEKMMLRIETEEETARDMQNSAGFQYRGRRNNWAHRGGGGRGGRDGGGDRGGGGGAGGPDHDRDRDRGDRDQGGDYNPPPFRRQQFQQHHDNDGGHHHQPQHPHPHPHPNHNNQHRRPPYPRVRRQYNEPRD